MQGELGTRVDLLEGLDRLALGILSVDREQSFLVKHAEAESHAIVNNEFEGWPVHV